MADAAGLRTRRGLCDGCGRLRPNPVETAARNPLEPVARILARFTPLPLPGSAIAGVCPICLFHRDEPDRWS